MTDDTVSPQATQKAAPRKTPQGMGNTAPSRQKTSGKKPNPQASQAKANAQSGEGPGPAGGKIAGLGVVMKRNNYYRDGYRNLQRVAFIQSIVIIALIAVHFFVINVHQPENRYFATTQDGRLVPMVPLNEPNLSNPALLSWVAQAATEVMTFGFHDFQNRLQESSRYFTTPGWASFSTALTNSRIIETIQQSQQVVTSAPRSAPIILQESIINDRYQWTIELPMKLTFQSGSKIDTRNWLVTIVIVRVPQLGNPNGLGIQQWIARAG